MHRTAQRYTVKQETFPQKQPDHTMKSEAAGIACAIKTARVPSRSKEQRTENFLREFVRIRLAGLTFALVLRVMLSVFTNQV